MEIKNLFSKGWQSDSEPSLQPPNTVRDLLNMRLISDSNNTYSLESLKGTLLSFSLNPNYFPIGWCRYGDDIAIFSTKDITGTDQNGEIGIAVIDPDTLLGTYTPYYNHQALNFNSAHQIESLSYQENNFIGRVYWTDEYSSFRALNLKDSRLTTYFATGSLVVGQQYMVVQGTATHATVAYGPNEAAGTVFTATGVNYTGTALVIEYIDVTLLDAVPSRDQGNISFNTWLPGGGLLGGAYQYCYQYYTSDGIETNFSYVSMPFHIGNTVTPAVSTLSYQAYQGEDVTGDSTKGQRIQIDNIDVNFDSIRVVAIHDTSLVATDPPKIIFSGPITSSTMTFDHLGNENLGTLSAADIDKVVLSITKVGTIATIKKRMFIGDIEFSPFVSLEAQPALTATPVSYLFPSDTIGRPTPPGSPSAETYGLSGHGISQAQVPAATGAIYKDQWYRVDGPVGSIINYNAGTVAAGSTFQGINSAISWTVNAGTPTVTAIIKIQKYTGAYRYIDILDDWLDNKGAAVATHLRSLYRAETYRWAIVFYDIFQNPQYAQWVADTTIPVQSTSGYELAEETDDYYAPGLHNLSLRSIGMKFSRINFNVIATKLGVTIADLPKYIGGFSIVRAPRDPQIYAQGVLQCTAQTGANNDAHPLSSPALANDKYGTLPNGRKPYGYTFYSPEFLFLFNGQPNPITGDKLRIEDYYYDAHPGFPGAGTTEGVNFHYYEKLHKKTGNGAFPATGSLNELDLTKSFRATVGETSHLIGSGPAAFQNNAITAGFLFGTELSCIGSEVYYATTTSDETGVVYPTTGYVSTSDHKAIVSFIRPNANLYGGTSASAKANTQYEFCGHYQPFDTAFYNHLVSTGGLANDIEVYGGDCFVSLFDVARMISDSTVTDRCSFGFCFPVESTINISLRQGRHLFKDRSRDIPSTPGIDLNGIDFAAIQQVEQFVYNNAYSYQESQYLYPALPANYVPNDQFLRRVYASPPKIDGEIVDNFRVFPVNDFIDLEGSNGELINLRAKSGALFYWQERGVGNLPVNMQTTIPNTLGQPISIGIGGVLELYNDVQDFYGNQHKFGLGEDESGFVWLDAHRKVLCSMTVSGSTANLSTNNGLRTLFSKINGPAIYNDNPVRNKGICAMYNAKYNEMLISFRGTETPQDTDKYSPLGFTISYDNQNQQFTGKFSMLPGTMIEVNNLLFVSYSGVYPSISGPVQYSLGNIVTEDTTNYICILGFTSPSVPIAPSSDSTHWKKLSSINEIHIADIGKICKFFGKVDDTIVQVVCNSSDQNEDMVFDNIRMQSDLIFFDTATYNNSHQSAVDNNITLDTDNYQYLNRSWFWSVPLDRTNEDRFRDHYMTLKLDKNNKLNGDPTASKDERIKIVSMRHNMRKSL